MRNIFILFVFLALFSANLAQAATITLALNPNSTTEPDGYYLYYGPAPRSEAAYTSNVDLGWHPRDEKFDVILEDLDPERTYCFAATAYDGSRNESSFSTEVCKTVSPNTGLNNPPSAAADSVTTNEDISVTINVLANDTDIDGDTLSIASITQPGHGATHISTGKINYSPAANYNGTDTFNYIVSDGKGGTATGTVTVTINPVNDAPKAAADSVTTNEDISVTINVLANDTDIDGDTRSIASITQPGHGATKISEGKIVYSPATNYNGTDTFNYIVSDGKGGTATGTVTVTVASVNDAPIAKAGPDRTVDEGASVSLDGNGSFDYDDGIATFLWTQTSGPSVTIDNPTSVTSNFRVPIFDQTGAILTFQLKVTDRGGLSNTDSVNLNVANVYEDAEDGSIAGWTIYDNDPAGATISNEYDPVRQSRVIKFTGANVNNGYKLQNADGSPWQNTSQFVIELGMNFAEDFWICINVKTAAGQRYLYYLPLDNDITLDLGIYGIFGLGSAAKNGTWQTFVRDLQSDLDKAQPGVKITEVNGLLLLGSGMIDDIKLQF